MKKTLPYLVLVVEDDPAVYDPVRQHLAAEGYRVAVATDYQQAVDALCHTRFDLVLADVIAATTAHPGADRPAILEHLRVLAGYTPVVIFTAHRSGQLAGLPERGFDELLLKPFDLDELLRTVRRSLPAT